MNRLARFRTPFLVALFLFIVVATLTPNPLGNNPDIIGDESYFLTSALTSIQHVRPPGLDFTPGGNYYGGPQTYIDTVVMIPVIGVELLLHHASVLQTQIWIALNTGYLLAILRFTNSLVVLAFCGFLFLFFTRKKIPRPLAFQLLFLLFLFFGNSLIAQFVHTAKMWTFYLLCDAAAGTFFIANEYYLSHFKEPFVAKKTYLAILTWTAAIAFFQSYVGLFPILLWIAYALLLRHFSFRELWEYVLKRWYYFAAFAVLQLSFLYRAAFGRYHPTWWDPGDVSTRTATDAIDWFHRLLNPIYFAFTSQPLLVLYFVGILVAAVIVLRVRNLTSRKKVYLAIAFVHPLLIYLVFHVVLGFSDFPRYALPLTVALSFSTVMLLSEVEFLLIGGMILSGLLFAVVMVHSIQLYWQPASDVVLTQELVQNYNSPQNVFIIEPDAWRLAPPINAPTLAMLNPRHQSMSRYQYLSQNLPAATPEMTFAPTVFLTDTDAEAQADEALYAHSTSTVWTISTDCNQMCSPAEEQNGTCFMLNLSACYETPQEINTLPNFLSFTELGNAYIVRRVH